MHTTDDQGPEDAVLVPKAQLDALTHELARVQARLDALEQGTSGEAGGQQNPTGAAAPGRSAADRGDETRGGGVGRRAAMAGLLGATVGGVVAKTGARPAAAATGGNFILGQNNTALDTTVLDAKGSGEFGLYVKNNGNQGVGIRSDATTAAAFYGYGLGTDINKAVGGFENGLDGLAIMASSDGSQVRLLSTSDATPVTNPQYSYEGELRGSRNGELWYCTYYGTPGTWRKLAGRTTAGSLHVLATPARIYDSRPLTNPPQGPKAKLSGNAARTLDLKVNSSGVPAGATAALLTILLVDAADGDGNMTVWAAGASRPQANTMVWGGSAGRFATSTISALDSQARIQVAASVSTNIVIDVTGYYR